MTLHQAIADKLTFWLACFTEEEIDILFDITPMAYTFTWDAEDVWEKYGSDTAVSIVNDRILSVGARHNLILWGVDKYYTAANLLRETGLTELIEHRVVSTTNADIDNKISELEQEFAELKAKKKDERDKEFRSILLAVNAFNEKHGEQWFLGSNLEVT